MNKIKFCSCQQCRGGRSAARNKVRINRVLRRFRKAGKLAARRGESDIPVVSVGYTD